MPQARSWLAGNVPVDRFAGVVLFLDMKSSCFHLNRMSTMIQIRNVPELMHRRLKARAAMEGVSMSQYVMWAIERALERPSRKELLAAIRRQPESALEPSPADVLRAERDARGDASVNDEDSGERER